MKITVRKATIDHVAYVAPRLREADRREVSDFCDLAPEQALWQSFYHSDMAWAIMADGVPVGIFGCGDCCPWMLGTDGLRDVLRHGTRAASTYLGIMLRRNGVLWNYVHADNHDAIRFLKWLGFDLFDPEPIGIDGARFRQFIMLSTINEQRGAGCAFKQQVS